MINVSRLFNEQDKFPRNMLTTHYYNTYIVDNTNKNLYYERKKWQQQFLNIIGTCNYIKQKLAHLCKIIIKYCKSHLCKMTIKYCNKSFYLIRAPRLHYNVSRLFHEQNTFRGKMFIAHYYNAYIVDSTMNTNLFNERKKWQQQFLYITGKCNYIMQKLALLCKMTIKYLKYKFLFTKSTTFTL